MFTEDREMPANLWKAVDFMKIDQCPAMKRSDQRSLLNNFPVSQSRKLNTKIPNLISQLVKVLHSSIQRRKINWKWRKWSPMAKMPMIII
jgi:hypothetical protein